MGAVPVADRRHAEVEEVADAEDLDRRERDR
jgi:hypothetical protein